VAIYSEVDLEKGGKRKEEKLPLDLVMAQIDRQENVRQRVFFFNSPHTLKDFKLLDPFGIVLSVNKNLQNNFARFLTRVQIPPTLIRRYHIGRVQQNQRHIPNLKGSKGSQKMMEDQECRNQYLEATFDIASPGPMSLAFSSGDELFQEAEVLRVCHQVALQMTPELGKSWYIRINSSEVLDGVLMEGNVHLNQQVQVLQVLAQMEEKPWLLVRKELLDLKFSDPDLSQGLSPALVDKMGELLKLKGPIEQMTAKLDQIKHLKSPHRFSKAIEYFKILRKYLKHFAVNQTESTDNYGTTFLFDFGLVLEEQINYYAGIFFKLQLVKASSNEVVIQKQQKSFKMEEEEK